ncbi:NAD(P)-dependent oxidoreductase [Kineosporia babensis]|uniref:NAD(P)-binding domain-containing protein n=1 Tax=Kineosporia babensis TaxID=499548 RepID=A0A9X1NFD1_9ACTN|nr:NAD(P)-binding domain-containing protein [Kineosporia babensis]MCD5312854.1 NAD(P)-binding domain-containing protein [Kineosporia babensis]
MSDVTMIGLGPMGQAMTWALLSGGNTVTVWNRTASRADPLRTAGATLATSPAEAVQASPVIVLSLTDHAAGDAVLDQVPAPALRGKVLVNLSSDTPDRSRRSARRAAGVGAQFLTGGVMVPAPMIGRPGAFVYYSGSGQVFDDLAPLLEPIGEARYLGADPGLAQLFYQASLLVFLTSLSGLLNAAALISAAGAPTRDFLPDALQLLTGIPAMIGTGEELSTQLETAEHPGDLSNAVMMGATAEHIVRTAQSSGVDSELPEAVLSHYQRTIAAGLGGQNWTALYEILRRTPFPSADDRGPGLAPGR